MGKKEEGREDEKKNGIKVGELGKQESKGKLRKIGWCYGGRKRGSDVED